jgi:hypothetical protein
MPDYEAETARHLPYKNLQDRHGAQALSGDTLSGGDR